MTFYHAGTLGFRRALRRENLEDRLVSAIAAPGIQASIAEPIPTPTFSVGEGPGGEPRVNLYYNTGGLVRSFDAYDPAFRGGVRVATADINGDGTKDVITAPGPGGGPDIRVFDGATGNLIREFLAYDPAFLGGVFVSAGDVNGDGRADIITGAGVGGGPHVKVFSGATGALLLQFFAYDPSFRGGVSVAAGDTTGDGLAEIITGAGIGGGPHVRVFNGVTGVGIASFFAFNPGLRDGVNVALLPGAVFGTSSIIAALGPGGNSEVRVFNNQLAEVTSFLAYDPSFLGGVTLGAAPAGPFGANAILTGPGVGGGPHVEGFTLNFMSAPTQQFSFLAFDPNFRGGVYVG